MHPPISPCYGPTHPLLCDCLVSIHPSACQRQPTRISRTRPRLCRARSCRLAPSLPVTSRRPHGRRGRPLPKALSREQIQRLFAQIAHSMGRALFLLILRCGLRVSEVAALKLEYGFNRLRVFRRAKVAYLCSGVGPKQETSAVSSDKCVARWGSEYDEIRMIATSFARVLERCTGHLYVPFSLYFMRLDQFVKLATS
jgi:integrase